MVFNATFNNISVISWRSVLLVEEIGVPGENHRSVNDERVDCDNYDTRNASVAIYNTDIRNG
jgi:hypothetical protein